MPDDAPATPSIESLVDDYLAPEQPEDCREASAARLAEALKRHKGPLACRGKLVSLDGDAVKVEDAPEPAGGETPGETSTNP